jgi:hypothetical protein
MITRYYNSKNDATFKKIFADKNHKHILINSLISVLDLESKIKDLHQ